MSDKIIVFSHASDTIQASKLLTAAGVAVKVVSIPEVLSFECGVSLVISARNQTQTEEVLIDHGITPAGIYDY